MLMFIDLYCSNALDTCLISLMFMIDGHIAELCRSSTSSTLSLLKDLNAINIFGFEQLCCCTSTLSDSSFFFSISRASLPVDCVKCSYVATTLSYSLSPLPFLRVKKGNQRHNRIQRRLEICYLSFLMQTHHMFDVWLSGHSSLRHL